MNKKILQERSLVLKHLGKKKEKNKMNQQHPWDWIGKKHSAQP